MITFIGLNYHYHNEYSTPLEVMGKHRLSSGYIDFLKKKVELILVKHLNYEGEKIVDGIRYRFLRSRNKSWYIPFRTHNYVYTHRADVVLVEGFVFPLQVMALRWKLGKHVVILTQHHGEQPFKGVKQMLQKLADSSIDGYLFTSLGNAGEWLEKGVISKKEKCFEVMSASTDFVPLERNMCKEKTGMHGDQNFLWVGRLSTKKDPVTVVKAFCEYVKMKPAARLYMIYQSGELLEKVKELVEKNNAVDAVSLVGSKPHDELPYWFSAADYFVAGSFMEGSGYALVEAMACGCIPVVTQIPSFRKITDNGRYGILYEPGNEDDLLTNLLKLDTFRQTLTRADIVRYATETLSYQAIADQLLSLSKKILARHPAAKKHS